MKRWIAMILTICLMLPALPGQAEAAAGSSGSCGEVSWQMDSSGTLYVEGKGRMLYHGGWDNNAVRKVVIGEGVTSICMGAFQNAVNLTTAVIAGTVRSIGFHSFDGCTALKQVWLPDSVVVVGEYAFNGCTALKDVRMGDRILMIGKYAFANCAIEVLDLPDGLMRLGSYAFTGCKMDTVVIPDTIVKFNQGTFADCQNLKNLYIPDSVKKKDLQVFRNCDALEVVVIPGSMEYTGGLLGGCDGIEKVIYLGDYTGDPLTIVVGGGGNHHTYELWYPADNPTWTREVRAKFEGNIRWMAYDAQNPPELPVITEPEVDESLFPREIKTYSAPKQQRKSIYNAAGGYVNPFYDVKADRFEGAVLWAFYNNITTGTSATLFSPEATCTRKQIVTVLWRYAGEPIASFNTNPFTDVKKDRFHDAITWAYKSNITAGTTKTTFSPEDPCTRKQIVTFLWRYAGQPEPRSYENPFIDVPSDRFEKAILWAYYEGITTGTGDGTTFSPEDPCTRKQIVTFLWRYAGQPDYSSRPAEDASGLALPKMDSTLTSATLTVGRSVELPIASSRLQMTSSVPGVVQLGEQGMITAVAPGTTVVRVYGKDVDARYTITVIANETDNTATRVRLSSAYGALYDGMTVYSGGSNKLTYYVTRSGQIQRLWVHSNNWYSVAPTLVEAYDARSYLTLEFGRPGDATLTILSDDGTECLTYTIHVEEFLPIDPGHDELLSPEEYACYASLSATYSGLCDSDSVTSWTEGSPLRADELTYENAIQWGLHGYYRYDGDTYSSYNYVGDQQWYGETCYRFQNAHA